MLSLRDELIPKPPAQQARQNNGLRRRILSYRISKKLCTYSHLRSFNFFHLIMDRAKNQAEKKPVARRMKIGRIDGAISQHAEWSERFHELVKEAKPVREQSGTKRGRSAFRIVLFFSSAVDRLSACFRNERDISSRGIGSRTLSECIKPFASRSASAIRSPPPMPAKTVWHIFEKTLGVHNDLGQ